VAEPLEASHREHGIKVLTKVTGEFPGSPTTLNFSFILKGRQIAALEIGA
jgi:hypothetical protein